MDTQTIRADACAVIDCDNKGRRQVCPFDGRYHHHGLIHYGPDYPQLVDLIEFSPKGETGWLKICDPHYAIIHNAMAEHLERIRTGRL